MKLMTLNTHSLVEPLYKEKKEKFIEMLVKEQPDVVALHRPDACRGRSIF